MVQENESLWMWNYVDYVDYSEESEGCSEDYLGYFGYFGYFGGDDAAAYEGCQGYCWNCDGTGVVTED